MGRGYFEIGIYGSKRELNLGTLWRSAYQMGASGIFTIEARYSVQKSDTCKAYRNIPLRTYEKFSDFYTNIPKDCELVAIEEDGHLINNFVHPERAIYLLGAEDSGLPLQILSSCDLLVSLESKQDFSYNVAVAGSIVMYHRSFLS